MPKPPRFALCRALSIGGASFPLTGNRSRIFKTEYAFTRHIPCFRASARSRAAGPRRLLKKDERSRHKRSKPGCTRQRPRQMQGTMILPPSHNPEGDHVMRAAGRGSCRGHTPMELRADSRLMISCKRGSGKNSLRNENNNKDKGDGMPFNNGNVSCRDAKKAPKGACRNRQTVL